MKITVIKEPKACLDFSDVKVGQVCKLVVDVRILKTDDMSGLDLDTKKQVAVARNLQVTDIFNIKEIILCQA